MRFCYKVRFHKHSFDTFFTIFYEINKKNEHSNTKITILFSKPKSFQKFALNCLWRDYFHHSTFPRNVRMTLRDRSEVGYH